MSSDNLFRVQGVRIDVRDLVKIYKYKGGEVQALRGVTATFLPGELTCIMGPSGSGKTTLMNLIGGIDVPTGGEVIVGPVKVHELGSKALDEYRLKYVGFVFQALNLVPTLTALENVMLPMSVSGIKGGVAKERAMKLLEMLGMKDKAGRYPEELSGGEQQRVAIAVALANDPPVILADEPTAELDSVNAKNIVNVLQKLAKELRKTVVLATHDPRVAVKADKIVRLEDGRITGEYKPIDLEKGVSAGVPEAAGVTQVSLAELIKIRLSNIDKELEDLEARFKRGEISLDEFYAKLSRIKSLEATLKELLTSLGTE